MSTLVFIDGYEINKMHEKYTVDVAYTEKRCTLNETNTQGREKSNIWRAKTDTRK